MMVVTPGYNFEEEPQEATTVNIDAGITHFCMHTQENITAKNTVKNLRNATKPGYVSFTNSEQSAENVENTLRNPMEILKMHCKHCEIPAINVTMTHRVCHEELMYKLRIRSDDPYSRPRHKGSLSRGGV